jgi:hypothetical protein
MGKHRSGSMWTVATVLASIGVARPGAFEEGCGGAWSLKGKVCQFASPKMRLT